MMRTRKHFFCITLLLFFTLSVAACSSASSPDNTVIVPASDTTPPTVGIGVFFPDGSHLDATDTTSPPSKQIKGMVGSKYVLTILTQGKDPEGMKSIEIWLSVTTTTCNASTGVCQKSNPLVGAPVTKSEDAGAKPGASADKDRIVAYQPDIAQEINSANALTYEIWATAINAHGMKTRSQTILITWSKL